MIRPRRLAAFWIACALLAAPPLAAKGALGFLTSHSTLTAGQAGSYMDPGRDWVPPRLTATAGDGHVYALPNQPQVVQIESWRTATDLHLKLSIPDQTRRQFDDAGNPIGDTLGIGDKVIVQIDPDNSGHLEGATALDTGPDPLHTDYRYEITLKDELIASIRKRVPSTGSTWGLGTNAPGLATLTFNAAQYVVDVAIPLADLGNPASDVGIAVAVIDDLGHGHLDGGANVWDVTGVAFPSTIPLAPGSDPGLVDAAQASGLWVNPSAWATGYFNVLPGEVALSHSPAYWWSDSIRISRCDVGRFADVQEPVTPGMSQLTLAGWYLYNPVQPCQMKVWVRAANSTGGVVQSRLFVVWGRPGIAPQDWFPVQLTGPIGFSSPEEIVSILWKTVPAVSFTDHPCLRVYVLPAVLTAPWQEAQVGAIATQAQLTQMEMHYGIAPAGDFQNAQMNFNAIGTGSCQTTQCAFLPPRPGGERIAGVVASLDGPALVQDQPPVARPGQEQPAGLIRVRAEGIGFAASGTRAPYTYLTPLGGIGWAFPPDRIASREGLTLPLEVTNPAVLFRDFSRRQDVPSPSRQVLVAVRAEASPGVALPQVRVTQPDHPLQPGESVKTGIVLTQPEAGPTGRFGFSLHAGLNRTHGDFARLADGYRSWMADFEVRLADRLWLDLLYGRHEFRAVTRYDVPKIDQLSVNLERFFGSGFWQLAVHAGGGAYRLDPGSTETGANAGLGVAHWFPSGLGVELSYDYHRVFASPDLDFSTLLLGLRWRP